MGDEKTRLSQHMFLATPQISFVLPVRTNARNVALGANLGHDGTLPMEALSTDQKRNNLDHRKVFPKKNRGNGWLKKIELVVGVLSYRTPRVQLAINSQFNPINSVNRARLSPYVGHVEGSQGGGGLV